MFKMLINKMVARHGLIPLILKVGDIAGRATRSKKDDKVLAKVKDHLEGF